MSNTYKTKEDVLRRAQEAVGKTFGEIDKTGRLSTGKGAAGNVIEESWFGYRPNSDPTPDFEEAGVELKVTPFEKTAKGIRAKERLVCDMLNYMEEYKVPFEQSAFWKKCACMLLMPYQYETGVDKRDLRIADAFIFDFPEEDLQVIRNDWKILMDKIKSGHAHEISEGDTMYLAACPKGRNAKDTRQQPFSDIPAMKRAYSLKQSYMTQMLQERVFGGAPNEHIIRDPESLRENTFEAQISKIVKPYLGMSRTDLLRKFNVSPNAKNANALLFAAMLGIKGNVAHTDEFRKASIVPKTIMVSANGKIKESMSFPAIDFCAIVNEEWETSTLYEQLAPTKFLFIIFKKTPDGDSAFQRIQFWNIPVEDLEEVHDVWQKTVNTLRRGVRIIKDDKGYCHSDLPKKSENRVSHVRPHGQNASDVAQLPDGGYMTKQCFWLNNTYIEKVTHSEEL